MWKKIGKDWWVNKAAKPQQVLRIVAVPQFLGRREYLYSVRVEERFGTKYKIIAGGIEKKKRST